MPRLKMNWVRKGKDKYFCDAYEIRTNYARDAATGFKYVLNFELYAQDTYVNTFETCGEAKRHACEMEYLNMGAANDTRARNVHAG